MIKRLPAAAFDTQQRNTVGKTGGLLRAGDAVLFCRHCRLSGGVGGDKKRRDDLQLLLLTQAGRAFSMSVRDVPKAARTARGRALEVGFGHRQACAALIW